MFGSCHELIIMNFQTAFIPLRIKMSAQMTHIYEVVSNLVRLARRFFKLGDEARSEKAREGIRSITENMGITGLQKQFPVEEILKTDLDSKIPQMNESGPYKHVLRYGVDFASTEEEGTEEIWLELWRICRKSHNMIAYVAQLYSIEIKWGQQIIRMNVLAMIDGIMQQGPVPAVLECGINNTKAYTTSRFDWEIFCAFSNRMDGQITAQQRLLFMLILDATAFDHCDVDAFVCWPASMVWDEMDRHTPGQYFDRFSAERAGLVELDEIWEEEPGSSGSEEKTGEESSEGRKDMGQSPILQYMETMELVKQYEEAERLDGNRFSVLEERSPEILRGPVAKVARPKKKKERRGSLSVKRKEKCVLTTAQFKAIMAMCIEGVNPRMPEEDIEKELEKVDVVELTKKMNERMQGMDEEEDVGELLRKVVREEGKGNADEEDDEMAPWSPGDAGQETEDERPPELELSELPEEMFSDIEDIEDPNESDELDHHLASTTTDEELEEMPDLVSSFPSLDNIKPEDWDTTWHSESSGRKSSKGNSPVDRSSSGTGFTPPPMKKAKSSCLAESVSTPITGEEQAIFSPFLTRVKEEDIVDVSSGSSVDYPVARSSARRQIVFPAAVTQGMVVTPPLMFPEYAYYADDTVLTLPSRSGETKEEEVEKEKASGDTSKTEVSISPKK